MQYEAKQQLATLAHADSVRVDSLAGVRKDLLDEVMSSTQFVAQINTELAKARSLSSKGRRKGRDDGCRAKVKANESQGGRRRDQSPRRQARLRADATRQHPFSGSEAVAEGLHSHDADRDL